MESKELGVETNKDITAQQLYDFLDFTQGAKYSVERGSQGKVHKGVFEAFCRLIEEIANKLSSIQIEDSETASEAAKE